MTTHDSDVAIRDYVALVRALGPGFHPDTDGADYTNLPAPYTPAEVDRIVEAATDHVDVYVVALDVLDGGDGTGPEVPEIRDVWDDLRQIADALGANLDPHGMIDLDAAGDRYVLIDHDEAFRVGLYDRDLGTEHVVMIETPTPGYAIEAARVLSRPGIEVK